MVVFRLCCGGFENLRLLIDFLLFFVGFFAISGDFWDFYILDIGFLCLFIVFYLEIICVK